MRDSKDCAPVPLGSGGPLPPADGQHSPRDHEPTGRETSQESIPGQVHAASVEPRTPGSAPRDREGALRWTCPSCGFSQLSEPEECPQCGVILAKLRDQAHSPDQRGDLSVDWEAREETTRATKWIGVIVGLLVCAVLGVLAVKWFSGGGPLLPSDQVGPPRAAGQVRTFTLQTYPHEVIAESSRRPVLLEFYSST
jgi:hypothetical protein